MSGREPLVSIGVPVYNGADGLPRALESLLTQTYSNFEIIICDNASQDATPEIGAEYAARDARISFHRNPENLGLARNFNRTFELAKGKYFKWATHDDWHAPQSLRLTVDLLEAHPNAVACGTGVSIVNEGGVEFDRWLPSADLLIPSTYRRFHRLIWMLGETHLMFGLLRSSALRQTPLMQSYLASARTMLAHLSLLGPIAHTPEALHYYTVSATARRNYRPSLHYDPASRNRLPLRTWRLIYKHLGLVARSDIPPWEKLGLAGSVVGRFGVKEFRRLCAETYHCVRILAGRGVRLLPRPALPKEAK